MRGIAKGCQKAGCALLGGETAELPGMYAKDIFDLAGFCVGLVSREKIIDGRLCCKGDKVIGLASSGLHSNGYSLVRKVFSQKEMKGKIGQELLRPTRIYSPVILRLLKNVRIKAMAHITGGGFIDNIPRVLPEGVAVEINKSNWNTPRIFRMIQEKGRIKDKEMFRTFNMGIGMVLVLSPQAASKALMLLHRMKQKAWVIGNVILGNKEVKILS